LLHNACGNACPLLTPRVEEGGRSQEGPSPEQFVTETMKTSPTFPAQSPALHIHPEIELLLHCARTSVDSTQAEQIRTLLRGDIDWPYLMRTAHVHRVIPLLYRSLHASCPEAVPKVISDQLQRHFHVNAFHNRFLTRELLKILKLLEAHRLSVIPYKGPALAAMAYGDLSLRQFDDLDLLIHKKDFQKAKELFISQGYQSELTDTRETDYLQSQYHLGFVRTDGRVTIELHWEVSWRYWPFPFDFERLWTCLTPVFLEGETIHSFPPEDLLLILCAHGSKHQWERLMWICDIAELVHIHQRIDWRGLMEQARTLGTKRMLLLGLFLANDLLGTDLPEYILQSIHVDPKVKSLAGQVSEQLFPGAMNGSHQDNNRPALYRTAFHFRLRERLRDKVQFFVHYPFHQFLRGLPTGLPRLLRNHRPGS
jgi:hypothetical protein